MRYICPECGSDILEGSDFCYSCGRKRDNSIRLDQSGHFVPPEMEKCASCGSDVQKGDLFCPNCGKPRTKAQMGTFRPKMVKNGMVGLLLAFIPGALGFLPIGAIGPLPGLFSIFGLGHLYFKKWTRGGMFLLMTAVMFFFRFREVDTSLTMNIIFTITSIFIYLLQAMEVLVLAYMPQKTEE
jgi:predicted RNA-binding Zn-ribbon protein involved in translation (DUF1610 family)